MVTTATREKKAIRTVEPEARETIINFNEAEATADIFTYSKLWQRHLEGKLGLKPTMDNGYGGRSYQLPKSRIRMPQPKKQYSEASRKAMAARLAKARATQPKLMQS